MELTEREFEEIRNYIYRVSGLYLDNSLRSHAGERLKPLLESAGVKTFKGLISRLVYKNDIHLCDQVILSITSDEDSFFIDSAPFETFRDVILPELADIVVIRKKKNNVRRGAKINIWSASASKGHEPYSIAMLISEYLDQNGPKGVESEDFNILASDLSSTALAKAVAGEYSPLEVNSGISEDLRSKYFTQMGDKLVLQPKIQDMVDFRKVNLSESFTRLGGFDVIFCRNALEHFNQPTQKGILTQFTYMLTRNGFLVLDMENNLDGFAEYYNYVKHNGSMVFQRKENMEFSSV